MILTLNDLPSFSINLIDDCNKEIGFASNKQKINILNWCILEMNKIPRPLKSSYQIKEEQVNFLLKDIERNLEELKKRHWNKK